jgi:hypothetical protein
MNEETRAVLEKLASEIYDLECGAEAEKLTAAFLDKQRLAGTNARFHGSAGETDGVA